MERDIDLVGLQRLLAKHWDFGELKDLCFELGVDFDEIAGETKSAKTRELVKRCYRYGEIERLWSTARGLRPDSNWNEIVGQEAPDSLPDEWAEPLQRLYALVRDFNRNRHQPFSDRRTFEGDDIAFRMRELAPYVFNQFDLASWLDSSSAGKRLAAIKYLDWVQDVEYLNELLKKLVTEGAFIQFHILLAVHSMVDQVEEQRIGLIRTALQAYKLKAPDPNREYWRAKILEALK